MEISTVQHRFSDKTCVIVALLHALSSMQLGGAAFVTGMGAFKFELPTGAPFL